MQRINISFSKEIYEKLEARQQEKEQKSLAEGVRELVDLGLKVEESAKKSSPDDELNDKTFLRKMLQKNLLWSMETRLLARLLIEHALPNDEEKVKIIFETFKEKAADHVKGLFHEEIL